jgi:hypothetical protein
MADGQTIAKLRLRLPPGRDRRAFTQAWVVAWRRKIG